MMFGFTVSQDEDYRDPEYLAARDAFIAGRADGERGWLLEPDRPRPPKTDEWRVELPHQCDSWVISSEDTWGGYEPHDVAVARLEAFIAEATEALAALRERREIG